VLNKNRHLGNIMEQPIANLVDHPHILEIGMIVAFKPGWDKGKKSDRATAD
jgi:hypothetical protein